MKSNFLVSLGVWYVMRWFVWKLSYEGMFGWSRHMGECSAENRYLVFFWKLPGKRTCEGCESGCLRGHRLFGKDIGNPTDMRYGFTVALLARGHRSWRHRENHTQSLPRCAEQLFTRAPRHACRLRPFGRASKFPLDAYWFLNGVCEQIKLPLLLSWQTYSYTGPILLCPMTLSFPRRRRLVGGGLEGRLKDLSTLIEVGFENHKPTVGEEFCQLFIW